MSKSPSNHRQFATILKKFRDLHRKAGAVFFLFFFVIALTGLFLGWKKNASDLIMPKDRKGSSLELQEWLRLEEIGSIAFKALSDSLTASGESHLTSLEMDRMDVRPSKGIVKVRFKPGFWEVQIDGASGKVLSIGKRYSDLIEKIHDGSIVEDWFGLDGVKLFYTTLTALVLILFTVTGFWMWYGPKKMRARMKHK